MHRFATRLLVAIACLALASCAAAGQGNPRTLRIGWIGEPDTLNPFMAVEARSYECFRLMYSWLIGFGRDLEPVPGLARRWSSSKDGLTWTYHLARGVNWHDGKPVTSADVKFTYDYIRRNKMDLLLPYISAAKRIDTPDPYTVVIHNSRPSVLMEQIFIPILPKHVWAKVPGKAALTLEDPKPIGSGAFRLVEWQKSRYIKFTANKQYFLGRPKVDDVVFINFANTNTMMQALRLGEIHAVSGVPPYLFRMLGQEPGVKTIRKASNGFTQLTLNTWKSPKSKGHPALRDARVRRAIAMGIDRKRLLDVARLGYGDVGTTIIPIMFPAWHWEPSARERLDYNPERARWQLERAGYTLGPDGVRQDRKGRPLRLRLFARTGSSEELMASQLIVEQLREVGVAVDLRAVESAAQDSLIKDNGDFDMALYAWAGDADPNFLLSLFHSKQIHNWNDYYYENPEYDRLFERQQTLVDRKQRRALLARMQQIIYRESPAIVLYYDAALQGFRTDAFAGWRDDQVEGVIMTLGGLTYTSIHPRERRS